MKDLEKTIFVGIFYDNEKSIFNQCWQDTLATHTPFLNYIATPSTIGQYLINLSLHPLDHHDFPLISVGKNIVFLVCNASQHNIVTLNEKISTINEINDKRLNIATYLLFYHENDLTLSYKNFPDKNTIFTDKNINSNTAKDIINTCLTHYEKSPKSPLQCAYFSFIPHNNQKLQTVFQCLPQHTQKGISTFLKIMKSIEKEWHIKLPKPLLGEIITYYVSNHRIRMTSEKEEKQEMPWVMRIEKPERKEKGCVLC